MPFYNPMKAKLDLLQPYTIQQTTKQIRSVGRVQDDGGVAVVALGRQRGQLLMGGGNASGCEQVVVPMVSFRFQFSG